MPGEGTVANELLTFNTIFSIMGDVLENNIPTRFPREGMRYRSNRPGTTQPHKEPPYSHALPPGMVDILQTKKMPYR